MFGFLSAPCSGCSSREHSLYRAHFCGLCNRLRKDYGLPMRFLVNRDATFLSILGNALVPEAAVPVSATCCNPLGKPRLLVEEGEAVSYAAAVTLCGLGAKLNDEVADRNFLSGDFALRGLRSLLTRQVSRAEDHLRSCAFPVAAVRGQLAAQSQLEEEAAGNGKVDLETLCGPTAFSFGKILSHTAVQTGDALERIGRSLGRMIYTLDAVKDRRQDEQTRQFNPFLLQPQLINEVPERLEQDQQMIATALSELPLFRYQDLLDLILGRNLQRTCAAVLNGGPPPPQGSRRWKKKKKQKDHAADSACDPFCDVCFVCDCCPGSTDCCDCCCEGDACCDCDVCVCDCG